MNKVRSRAGSRDIGPLARREVRLRGTGSVNRGFAVDQRVGTGEQLLLGDASGDTLAHDPFRAGPSSTHRQHWHNETALGRREGAHVQTSAADNRPSVGGQRDIHRLPSADPPMLLTVAQVEATLQLGRTRTYELLRSGEIPVRRVGRLIRVSRSALEQWVAQSDDASSDANEAH
jgi:excisionase family DNA binding protein